MLDPASSLLVDRPRFSPASQHPEIGARANAFPLYNRESPNKTVDPTPSPLGVENLNDATSLLLRPTLAPWLGAGHLKRSAKKMIKAPRFLEETGDLYCRRIYVVRPNDVLLDEIRSRSSSSGVDLEYIQMPRVVMTEEVPFERDLEGWRPAILRKCKQAFVVEMWEDLETIGLPLPDAISTDLDVQLALFDSWWIAEEAEEIEIVAGSWKQ